MDEQITKSGSKGKPFLILGFVGIAILFLIYSRFQNPEITPDAIPVIQRMALGFYIVLLLCFGAISFGLYKFHKQKAYEKKITLVNIIASITWNNKSRKIFVVTFIAYGVFFSLSSGTLVYQPEVIFSYHYGAIIPSAEIIPCCGQPGYVPSILVYITEHIGLQIIPINLVLQITVSYLVGLNTTIAISTIALSKKGRSLSGIGATTGLFIACPTCVGTFLSIFIGTASGIALTIAITHLQTLFIAITIPILLVTPFILANRLKNLDGSCAVE